MKQLYAAGPLMGREPQVGLSAVRATSAGVKPDELVAALSAAGYTPPPANTTDRKLPVRLALLNTPAGRLLTHIAPNGGTYFAHTLLDVPASADAQLAIQTWGSPQWQRHDPDSPADLPDLPYLPVADVLDDAAVQKWLDAPARRDLLEFVLTALLGTPPTTRVIVAAPADDVARVVYAVTRSLPPGLLDDFTFSTYEPDPLACPARLVGYDAGADDLELPAGCYADGCVGFNPATGKRSELAATVPFAGFAADCLATGECGPLDEVKATWQRLGLTDRTKFDLVFRLARGTGVWTKEEAAEALQHPTLAAWVSSKTDAVKQFLDWAMDDREFATGSFTKVVQTLRQKPDHIAKVGPAVRELGLKMVRTGDLVRTANALEVVLPMVAPAKATAVWGELLAQLGDPTPLAWPTRWYLLPRFVRFKQQQGASGIDPALARWVDVPADKLGELLALDLPRAYQLAAGWACLNQPGEPSAELARTIGRHPGLTLTLLQPDEHGLTDDRSVQLFERLLAEAPEHPWFEDLLRAAGKFPADLLNRFFEATLASGKLDADRVIRTQGPQLLELFAGQSGLDRLGTQFLANPPADLLHNPSLLGFLDRLRDEPQVGDALQSRIAAVKAVRGYLDEPAFAPEPMTAAAEALRLTPPAVPASAKNEVFAAVSGALAGRATSESLQADLEAVLVRFGDVLANDPADLSENLLRDLRGRTDFARRPGLVHAFLAVALGAAKSPELVGKLDGLDVQAFAIATESAKAGGRRLLAEIDARTSDWPKAAKTQWGFLKAAVQPRSRLLRDVAVFVAGAAVASVGWAVMRFVG
ncbi:MAG: hypothetical protein U0871_12205 [Gemmataceae bacterium]